LILDSSRAFWIVSASRPFFVAQHSLATSVIDHLNPSFLNFNPKNK